MVAAAIRVSAPAKVLLFGEHAVVYGSACVAAALNDLRLHVAIHTNDPIAADNASAAPTLTLVFRDLVSAADGTPLQRSFELAQLQAIATDLRDDAHYLPQPSDAVLQRIDALLATEAADDARALRPAVFLCIAVLRSTWRPLQPIASTSTSTDTGTKPSSSSLTIEVSATDRFSIGAGLGSSAAFSVALAAALLLFQSPAAAAVAANEPLDTPTLARINACAFAAETILHGAPSGVDNTVATYGGAIVFTKRQQLQQQQLPTAATFARIKTDLNVFRFLLVHTRVARSTKQQVANVRTQLETNRVAVERHFAEIDAIARTFVAQSEQQPSALTESAFATLLARNHALLNALGVGHDAIERVANVANAFGATTKLTGAGGGGCTLSLLPQTLDDAALQQLVDALDDCGFDSFVSAVGGAGVQREMSELS